MVRVSVALAARFTGRAVADISVAHVASPEPARRRRPPGPVKLPTLGRPAQRPGPPDGGRRPATDRRARTSRDPVRGPRRPRRAQPAPVPVRRSPPRPPTCRGCLPGTSTRPGCWTSESMAGPGSARASASAPSRLATPSASDGATWLPQCRGLGARPRSSRPTGWRGAIASRLQPWTTTSTSWRLSPGPCPEQQHWPRPNTVQ